MAGPEQFRLDELVPQRLATLKDPREVIADPMRVTLCTSQRDTLVPGSKARVSETRFETWLAQPIAFPTYSLRHSGIRYWKRNCQACWTFVRQLDSGCSRSRCRGTIRLS